MQQLSTFLIVIGFGSMALNLMGMEFRLLGWIDAWGPGIGWTIRAAIGGAGVLLFILSRRQETSEAKG